MKAIVAVDSNWGIGHEGKLLQSIPEDMQFFKSTTLHNVVVMGRETFESLPGKRPLKDRVNIVLTRNKDYQANGVILCHSIEDTLEKLKCYPNNRIFIIGGEAIYKAFLPYCDEVLLTKMYAAYPATKFFPNIDLDSSWNLDYSGELKDYNGINYHFNLYKKG